MVCRQDNLNPVWKLIVVAGAHDNGYTSTLNLLQNEGLLDKVVLLKGYKDLAHEINNLNLPQLEVEGVFIQKKLHSNGKQKVAAAVVSAAATPVTKSPKPPKQAQLQTQDTDKARYSKPGTPSSTVAKLPTPVRKVRPLDPEQVRARLLCIVLLRVNMVRSLYHSLFTNVSEARDLENSDRN